MALKQHIQVSSNQWCQTILVVTGYQMKLKFTYKPLTEQIINTNTNIVHKLLKQLHCLKGHKFWNPKSIELEELLRLYLRE